MIAAVQIRCIALYINSFWRHPLVGVANVIDNLLFGHADTLRTAVICFYVANESLSIIENAIKLNVPIPDTLKDKLAQLHGGTHSESKSDEK